MKIETTSMSTTSKKKGTKKQRENKNESNLEEKQTPTVEKQSKMKKIATVAFILLLIGVTLGEFKKNLVFVSFVRCFPFFERYENNKPMSGFSALRVWSSFS